MMSITKEQQMEATLTDTITGKPIQITDARWELSANRYCSSGFCLLLRFSGMLARSKKPGVLSYDYSWEGGASIRKLFGYAKASHVAKDEWISFMRSVPIEQDRIGGYFPVTKEVEIEKERNVAIFDK
jgi:hypothetical protein